jgi:hypothetical protein
MASLIWTTVFGFLVLELILTAILVVPVPRKIRNFLAKEINKFQIGERLAKPILFIAIALTFALVESYFTRQRILARESEEIAAGMMLSMTAREHDKMFHSGDRERKYKSERNMYLAGFSLTLLFVIGRITQLMQESIELEEECDRVQKFKSASDNVAKEEKPKQPVDKKKD